MFGATPSELQRRLLRRQALSALRGFFGSARTLRILHECAIHERPCCEVGDRTRHRRRRNGSSAPGAESPAGSSCGWNAVATRITPSPPARDRSAARLSGHSRAGLDMEFADARPIVSRTVARPRTRALQQRNRRISWSLRNEEEAVPCTFEGNGRPDHNPQTRRLTWRSRRSFSKRRASYC